MLKRPELLRECWRGAEDWRNLSHRADYEEAVEEMLVATDHIAAPWCTAAAESKHYARVKVLEIVISTIEDALRGLGRTPSKSRPPCRSARRVAQ
jgi:polyphosphate kinase 2 (PPK2 family)